MNEIGAAAEGETREIPFVSIVLSTYNRPAGAASAVKSILAVVSNMPHPTEIVIVDDGSSEEASGEIDALAGESVTVIHQPNGGLASARVRGVNSASGMWLTFLDDDDRWLPEWSALMSLMEKPNVGIVSGGAQLVTPSGDSIGVLPPRPLGPVFSDSTAQYLAGCFAVRRDLYDASGGYLPGLVCSEQSELFIRCAAVAAERNMTTEFVSLPVASIERRPADARQLSNPRLVLDGTRWILARHAARFKLDPVEHSNWEAVASLSAVRLGEKSATRHAARAARLNPTNIRAWVRLAIAWSPMARMKWGNAGDFATLSAAQHRPLAHAVSFRGTEAAALLAPSDYYFLPWRYRENPPASDDASGNPFWEGGTSANDVRYQQPIYRWAAKLIAPSRASVLDIGCGSGHKLATTIAPVAGEWLGIDQPSAIDLAQSEFPNGNWLAADLSDQLVWDRLAERRSDLVLCADVIEHLLDPLELLTRLCGVVRPGGHILISTPDRNRLEGRDSFGPPLNPRHIREWTEDEMRLLVSAAGLKVVRVRHFLPRSYDPFGSDLRRIGYRLLHRRAVPDRRNSMAFLLKPSESAPMENE